MGTRPRARKISIFSWLSTLQNARARPRLPRGLLVYCGAIKSTLLGTTANTARAMFLTTHPAAIAAGFAVAGHTPRRSGTRRFPASSPTGGGKRQTPSS